MSRLLLLPPYQPGNVPSQPTAGQVIVATGVGNRVKGVTQGPIAQAAIPFIMAPTGTMANNGAITLGTALPTTYANAYIYLPAGAIVAAGAAGWYFVQMSSATLGTVFNNTYTSGLPTIPASPTAFVTTGPGAYTGATSLQNSISITVPGGSMGPNGTIRYAFTATIPNNADSKTVNAVYSTLAASSLVVTTSASVSVLRSFSNRGVTNSQVTDGGVGLVGTGTSAGAPQFAAIDSTQAQTFAIQVQLAVATDYIVIERFFIEAFFR